VRVITGSAKGRKLASVPGSDTRPITARVKSALFSIIGDDIREARVLDLFGGTGAVGIEALSRGAAEVVFVERAVRAVQTIARNLELTRLADRAQIIHADAFRYLAQADPALEYDLIYVAPPQFKLLWAKALLALDEKPLLAPEGLIVVQIFPKEFQPLTLRQLEQIDERQYGSTALHLYMLREDEPGGATEELTDGDR